MSVGTISSFDNLQSSIGVAGTLHKPSQVGTGSDGTFDITAKATTKYVFGSGAADTCNQVAQVIFTAVKNVTTTLDLSASLANAVGDAAATFTRIIMISIEYLTVAQDAVNGTASTGAVTIKPGAANPITTSPLAAAQQYVMKPGDKWKMEKHDVAGIVITNGAADTFDFVHADNSVDAHFLITIYGDK